MSTHASVLRGSAVIRARYPIPPDESPRPAPREVPPEPLPNPGVAPPELPEVPTVEPEPTPDENPEPEDRRKHGFHARLESRER